MNNYKCIIQEYVLSKERLPKNTRDLITKAAIHLVQQTSGLTAKQSFGLVVETLLELGYIKKEVE